MKSSWRGHSDSCVRIISIYMIPTGVPEICGNALFAKEPQGQGQFQADTPPGSTSGVAGTPDSTLVFDAHSRMMIHGMVTHRRRMTWQQNNNLVKWEVCFRERPHGREQQGPPTQPSYSETSSQFKAGMFGPVTAKREPESRIFIAGIYIRA